MRFGRPRREVALEAEAYQPKIVVLFSAAHDVLSRLRGWALRRRLARQHDARVLVLRPTPRAAGHRAPAAEPVLTPPAPLPARRE